MASSKIPFFYRGNVLAVVGVFFFALWIGWFSFLIIHGSVPWPEGANEFEATGQFGDSFGFLASFMSTMAVLGALFTIHVQSRNYERQQFEQNFYILLGSIRTERDNICVEVAGSGSISNIVYKEAEYDALKSGLREVKYGFDGVKAVGLQILRLRDAIGVAGYSDVKGVAQQYRKVMKAADMNNYFRLLYHLYSMIDRAPVRDKYFYARIVRAHLSSAEAKLVAYNCIVGEGRHKFLSLVQKYSVLHNIGRQDLDDYASQELEFFQRKISESAFRFEKFQPIKY